MKKFINKKEIKGKLLVADSADVLNLKFSIPGVHHRENLACAVLVAKTLGISEPRIKKAVSDFKDLEGRLQLLKVYKGIKIYNDNNATTPEATIASIEALASPRPGLGANIILISGGSDKNIPLTNFVKAINKYCKAIVLIPGNGTEKLAGFKLRVGSYKVENLIDAVEKALGQSKEGDIILFSPAFASFGVFNNEYERNDLFMKIVKRLK